MINSTVSFVFYPHGSAFPLNLKAMHDLILDHPAEAEIIASLVGRDSFGEREVRVWIAIAGNATRPFVLKNSAGDVVRLDQIEFLRLQITLRGD